MSRTFHYFTRILAVLLISFSFFALSSCGMFSNDGMGFFEDTESSTSVIQASEQPATFSDSDNGNFANKTPSPDGTYKWTQTFVESNYSGKTAFTAETAVIVINSDNSGMINEFIPCRLNGDQLFIEYPMGDAGNSTSTGTLSITTIDGKKHLEGTITTSNPDGFTVKEIWIMDAQ